MPKKSSRRRSGDDTGRHFTRAAKPITRLRPRPAQACGMVAMLWLADTLDWLDLWHPGVGEEELSGDQLAANNHLSPRL